MSNLNNKKSKARGSVRTLRKISEVLKSPCKSQGLYNELQAKYKKTGVLNLTGRKKQNKLLGRKLKTRLSSKKAEFDLTELIKASKNLPFDKRMERLERLESEYYVINNFLLHTNFPDEEISDIQQNYIDIFTVQYPTLQEQVQGLEKLRRQINELSYL